MLGKKGRKPALVDHDDCVVADVYCIRCGHNLRSSGITRRCEHCNHPVSDSVFGDYLVHADREYVRHLAEAARFVRIGAGFLGGLVAIGLVVTLITEIAQRDLRKGIDSVFGLLFAGAMIAPLVAAVGLATLTNRHTVQYYQVRYLSGGNLIYLCVAAVAGLLVFAAAAYWFDRPMANLVLSAWAVIPAALFMHRVARLMHRVPDKELAGLAKFAYWGVLVCGAALFCVLMLRGKALEDRTWQDMKLGLTAIYIVGSIALGIGAFRLLNRVEDILLKAAR